MGDEQKQRVKTRPILTRSSKKNKKSQPFVLISDQSNTA